MLPRGSAAVGLEKITTDFKLENRNQKYFKAISLSAVVGFHKIMYLPSVRWNRKRNGQGNVILGTEML